MMNNNKNKSDEGDSNLQMPTGIQRHRLRALFGGEDEGNTPELTGRTGNLQDFQFELAKSQ